MASHPDFVDFVADQLREAGTIRSRMAGSGIPLKVFVLTMV